jgi:hypothetical protein
MLIQLLVQFAVGQFVTLPFGSGAAVTRAILIGTLHGLVSVSFLPETPEIDDVAHDGPETASAPGSRAGEPLKVHNDSNHHAVSAPHQNRGTIIKVPSQSCRPTNAQYVGRNTIQRHVFVIYTMIPAAARELR